MKKSLVTATFLKQKARQLKKEKNISLHQALDEISKEFGFSNYRHYINQLESNRPQAGIESVLKYLSMEKDESKKIEFAVLFVQNNNISFPNMFNLLEQFQQSKNAVQLICENSAFDYVAETSMLNYFLQSKEDLQALPLREHFVAKNIIIENLVYELITERLNITGLYTIEFEFEFLSEVEEEMRNMSHFKRDPMFGKFEMTIDRNRQVTIANPSIGEISDEGKPYLTQFKLGQFYLDEIKKSRISDGKE